MVKEKNMKPTTRNRQKGIALMFVLFALLLLTILAGGMMFMSNTDIGVNANYRDSQLAYFAARAGVEEVRQRMKIADPNTLDSANLGQSFIPQAVPSAGGGVLYVINQATDPVVVTPWAAGSTYMDDELCHGGYVMAGLAVTAPDVRCTTIPNGTAWYQQPGNIPAGQQGGPAAGPAGPKASTGPNAGAASALSYKWVRVTMKENQSVPGYSVDGTPAGSATANTPICWNGTSEVLLAGAPSCRQMTPPLNPVYLVASLAVSRSGARRMVETEVAKNILPPVPSALTLDGGGAAPFFGTPHSNNFGIGGTDACNAANVKPAIGVVTPADQVGVSGDVFRPADYTGQAPPPPASPTPAVVNLAPNPVPNPNPLQNMTTVADLQAMVTQITQMAPDPQHIINPANPPVPLPSFGTPGNPATATVIVIQGNWSGNCSGNGILLVTGNLTCSGGTSYDGLIAAIGTGSITFQGGGNGNLNGAIFEGNLFDAAGRPLPGSSLPGIPKFVFNGGGTNFLQYNSCMLMNANNFARARTINTREVIY
jgi:hypothetical protein